MQQTLVTNNSLEAALAIPLGHTQVPQLAVADIAGQMAAIRLKLSVPQGQLVV